MRSADARAPARASARRPASRESCRRRSRRASMPPAAERVDHLRPRSAAVLARTRKPHALRPRARASRRRRPATQPTSAPPCTPEWPRIGISPRCGRPDSPRARPTLTSALTVSTPCACCVRPIDQTKIGVRPIGAADCANAPHVRLGSAPLSRLERAPVGGERRRARARRSPRSCCVDERAVDARPPFDQRLAARRSGTRDRRRCARRTSGRRGACRTARSSAIDGTQ